MVLHGPACSPWLWPGIPALNSDWGGFGKHLSRGILPPKSVDGNPARPVNFSYSEKSSCPFLFYPPKPSPGQPTSRIIYARTDPFGGSRLVLLNLRFWKFGTFFRAVHGFLAFAVPAGKSTVGGVALLKCGTGSASAVFGVFHSERPLLAGRESSANWGTSVVIVSVN